jgi:hypothetical protein
MNTGIQTNSRLFENAKNYFLRMEEKRLGHPLVGGDVSIDLTNYANYQYTGPLWMGSNRQRVDVIYDTGSDWLVLDTDFCTDCHLPVFKTKKSSTYNVVSGELLN